MRIQALRYLTFDTVKGTTTDKQDVARIDGNIFLVRMLTAALGRHVHVSSFQQLQQALLDTLATDITGNRRVVCLTGYLVHLVDKHDTALSGFHIIVSHLQQTGQNALHILAHIASLGKHRGIDDGKWYVQQFGYRTSQQRFTCTRRTHHNDIRLLYLNAIVTRGLL